MVRKSFHRVPSRARLFAATAFGLSHLLLIPAAPARAADPLLEQAARQLEEPAKPSEKGRNPPESKRPDKPQRDNSAEKSDEPSGPATLQDQRDAEKAKKRAEKRKELRSAIRHARQLIDNDKDLRKAYDILREVQSRLGIRQEGPPDREIRTLLARIALKDNPPSATKAIAFIAPFVGGKSVKSEKALEKHFETWLIRAKAMLQQAATEARTNPPKSKDARKSPDPMKGKPGFMGVPFNAKNEQPGLTENARSTAHDALVILDHLAGHTTGRNQIDAAAACGDALVLLGRFNDAKDAYQFALHQLKAGTNAGQIAFDSKKIDDLRSRLRKKLNKARRLHDIARYALEYVLYKEANQHERAGRYKKAIAKYKAAIDAAQTTMAQKSLFSHPDNAAQSPNRQTTQSPNLKESPYTAAAKYHIALCQRERGQTKQAIQHLQRFIQSDPGTQQILKGRPASAGPDQKPQSPNRQTTKPQNNPPPQPPNRQTTKSPNKKVGLYRGQALLTLDRIALEQNLNFNRADHYFTQLDHWITAVRKENKDWHFSNLLPGIKKAAKNKTDGPEHEKRKDRWGNVEKTKIKPGQLVNRKTTPWYLDDLEEDAVKYQAFLAFLADDEKRANRGFSASWNSTRPSPKPRPPASPTTTAA